METYTLVILNRFDFKDIMYALWPIGKSILNIMYVLLDIVGYTEF